jgi:mannose-6-phosphate isomerase-like protein (cupin superfamily)
MRLLADGPATAGQLSVHRTLLRDGANGAGPHHHTMAAELFYVLSGTLQVLIGDDIVIAEAGDVAMVPPGISHAFAAAPGCDAELLAVVTPGAVRFDFFRRLARVAAGEEPPGPFVHDQSSYDVHPDDSPAWRRARDAGTSPSDLPKDCGTSGEDAGSQSRTVRDAGNDPSRDRDSAGKGAAR